METLPPYLENPQGSALYMAVFADNILEVRRLLTGGADVNFGGENLCSPLHLAVSRQNIEIVKILLEYGANPNLESLSDVQSTLDVSVHQNNVEIVKMLLDYGANTNGKMILIAVENRNLDILKLLLEKGEDPNYSIFNITALHVALNRSLPYIVIIKALLEAGADVNATDYHGRTALHLARCPDIVVCLLENGARINAQDNRGRTPLLLSIIEIHKKENVIEPLLFAGADVNIPNNYGKTFKEEYESKKNLCKGVHDTMEKFRTLKVRSDITQHFDETNIITGVLNAELESITKTNVEGICLDSVLKRQSLPDFVFYNDSTFRKIIRGDVFKNMFPHFYLLIRLSFREAEKKYFVQRFSYKLTETLQLNVPFDIGYLIIGLLDERDVKNLHLALQ